MTRGFSVFEAEQTASLLLSENGLLVAFDEVGRGCLAGPVVAGCTLWRRGTPTPAQQRLLPLVDDSKALSALRRSRIASEFDVPLRGVFDGLRRDGLSRDDLVRSTTPPHRFEDFAASKRVTPATSFVCVAAGMGFVHAEEIDASDIWTCVQLAMARALAQATSVFPEPPPSDDLLFVVDGNCGVKVSPQHADVRQITCVKGDSRFVSLGLSSILAKVTRDAFMTQAATTHPEYGFEKHKGYGTAAHFEALRRHAPMSLHRRTFLRSLANP
ncbi:MAG: ribonuclease HII [Silvanigrellales bacterium]|nr:ribonuclease HII [Silvanigrellales bacterium]